MTDRRNDHEKIEDFKSSVLKTSRKSSYVIAALAAVLFLVAFIWTKELTELHAVLGVLIFASALTPSFMRIILTIASRP